MAVGISGPAAAGKSTLARSLVAWIGASSCASGAILCIDGYLADRTTRGRAGLSGYDPASYDLGRAREDLNALLGGRSVPNRDYDHVVGELRAGRDIDPADLIIVEGVHAFNPTIAPLLDGKIFIDASMPSAVGLRALADLDERGHSIEQAASHVTDYYSYVRHAERYLDHADVVLTVRIHRLYTARSADVTP